METRVAQQIEYQGYHNIWNEEKWIFIIYYGISNFSEIKNKIGHRAKAVNKLIEFLSKKISIK